METSCIHIFVLSHAILVNNNNSSGDIMWTLTTLFLSSGTCILFMLVVMSICLSKCMII